MRTGGGEGARAVSWCVAAGGGDAWDGDDAAWDDPCDDAPWFASSSAVPGKGHGEGELTGAGTGACGDEGGRPAVRRATTEEARMSRLRRAAMAPRRWSELRASRRLGGRGVGVGGGALSAGWGVAEDDGDPRGGVGAEGGDDWWGEDEAVSGGEESKRALDRKSTARADLLAAGKPWRCRLIPFYTAVRAKDAQRAGGDAAGGRWRHGRRPLLRRRRNDAQFAQWASWEA